VTIAAVSFLKYNRPPARGHLTLWIEEHKIPPVEAAAASDR